MPAAVAFAVDQKLAASSDRPVSIILRSCVHCGPCKLFCTSCRAGVRAETYLLTCGAGVLATQHKGSCSAINAFSSGPPVTAQTCQGEHHLLLVCHGSVMHWSAWQTNSSVYDDAKCGRHASWLCMKVLAEDIMQK